MIVRCRRNHIIIIDGTLSSLKSGFERNAGLTYKLLDEVNNPKTQTLYYDSSVQGHWFWNMVTVASGWGINRVISNAYGHLSVKYRLGDKIYLLGFSRGAFAMRSLAGMINQLGLLRRSEAMERQVHMAFRLYEWNVGRKRCHNFRKKYCHGKIPIEFIGVWDTVKTLGSPYPLLTRLAPMATEFHDDKIGGMIRFAFHALALHETRLTYKPILWDVKQGWRGHLEQVWFRGAHSDIGGNVQNFSATRGLSNISLVWMLKRLSTYGVRLPDDWRSRFHCDSCAPMIGTWRGLAKCFIFRAPRILGRYPQEFLHPSTLNFLDRPITEIPLQKNFKPLLI